MVRSSPKKAVVTTKQNPPPEWVSLRDAIGWLAFKLLPVDQIGEAEWQNGWKHATQNIEDAEKANSDASIVLISYFSAGKLIAYYENKQIPTFYWGQYYPVASGASPVTLSNSDPYLVKIKWADLLAQFPAVPKGRRGRKPNPDKEYLDYLQNQQCEFPEAFRNLCTHFNIKLHNQESLRRRLSEKSKNPIVS